MKAFTIVLATLRNSFKVVGEQTSSGLLEMWPRIEERLLQLPYDINVFRLEGPIEYNDFKQVYSRELYLHIFRWPSILIFTRESWNESLRKLWYMTDGGVLVGEIYTGQIDEQCILNWFMDLEDKYCGGDFVKRKI